MSGRLEPAAAFDALCRDLGHAFRDPMLLRAALTHPSLGGRIGADIRAQFERLEFLGDRVLSLIVVDLLLARHPHEAEGDLARRHAQLVRRESLAVVATALGLDRALQLLPGQPGLASEPSVLADAFEAVLGALYLDGGLEPPRRVVARQFADLVDAAGDPPRDAKTGLQEWAQGHALGLPVYRIVHREGPAHQPRFVAEVSVASFPPARGEGSSKQLAEQQAAAVLLAQLDGTTP